MNNIHIRSDGDVTHVFVIDEAGNEREIDNVIKASWRHAVAGEGPVVELTLSNVKVELLHAKLINNIA